jgi:hypothetical protein
MVAFTMFDFETGKPMFAIQGESEDEIMSLYWRFQRENSMMNALEVQYTSEDATGVDLENS